MTIAAVGGQLGGQVADSATSVSRAFGSNVSAGSLIIVVCEKFANSQDVFVAGDCTKSAGTATLDTITLDKEVSVQADTSQWVHTGIWSALVTGAGSCTMQVAGAVTGSYLHIATGEFTGSFDGSRLETSNSNSTTSDSTTSAGTGNGTSAGAAMFVAGVAINTGSNIAVTEDAAFSLIAEEQDGTAHVVGSAIYRIVTSGTTDEGSWTIGSANTGWCAALAVYKEAAGGATFTPRATLLGVG